jgi:hypothetical protein
LVYEFKAALEPRYDPAATEDREAIAVFMRGERGPRPAPEFPHKQISSMSNKDFKRELEKIGVDPVATRIE